MEKPISQSLGWEISPGGVEGGGGKGYTWRNIVQNEMKFKALTGHNVRAAGGEGCGRQKVWGRIN
jgi:hypothetical protein